MSDEFRWKPVTKDPGETRPVELDLFGLCAKFWAPNELIDEGEIVWPIVEDEEGNISGVGYCFEATQSGQARTGSIQPAAFRSTNITVDVPLAKLDGSVQWTPRSPTSGGITPITDVTAVPPDGITVPGCVISEQMKLLVDYAGGEDGNDYEVEFRFVIGGRLRVGRQTVQVRKK